MTFDIRRYTTVDGIDRFGEWFEALGDRQAQARVRARVDRLGRGLFGDVEPCGEGVWEQAKEYWRDYQERTKTKGKRNR